MGSFIRNLYRTYPILTKKDIFYSKEKKIDQVTYYWLKNLQNNRNLTKKFQRTTIKKNFAT